MTSKSSIILICVLVSVILIAGPSKVEGRFIPRLRNFVSGVIRVGGTVFCTANGGIGADGTSSRVFSNATVELRCGNGVVTTVRTNSVGVYQIFLDVLQFPLTSLITNCRIVVTTPLSVCDATLSSDGELVSTPLQFVGNMLPIITNVIPVTVVSFTAAATIP